MRIRIITYIFLLLSLSVSAQTKRALVIGLGEQQDKAWNKINGDKDVPFVQAMLKNAGFKSVTTLVNRHDKGWHCRGIQTDGCIMQTRRCGIYPLFWTWTADDGCT